MRSSCLQRLGRHIKLKFQVRYFPGVGGFVGLVKLKLKLNSAEAEAKASSLGLAELGNITYS